MGRFSFSLFQSFFHTDRDSALDLSFKDEADDEMTDYFEETWTEQFCPVAEQLLQRIETHQSDLEPLDNPSGS